MSVSKTPIIAICFVSVICGIITNLWGLSIGGPHLLRQQLGGSTPMELRAWLHLKKDWGGHTFDKAGMNLLLLLLASFKNTFNAPNHAGRAMLALIFSIFLPVGAWQSVESVKLGQSKLLGPTAVILYAFLGQIAMLGFITPAVFVPMYAYVLFKKKTNAKRTASLPSLPIGSLRLVRICNLACISFASLSIFWPINDPESYALVNTIFQFFFLGYLPLIFIKPETGGSKDAEYTATFYNWYTWTTSIIYWISLYFSTPALIAAAQKGQFTNDGVHLLFSDTLGYSVACLAIVGLHRWYDDAALFKSTDIISLVKSVVLGPGHLMAKHFAFREGKNKNQKSS